MIPNADVDPLHSTNPTRQRGPRREALADASGWCNRCWSGIDTHDRGGPSILGDPSILACVGLSVKMAETTFPWSAGNIRGSHGINSTTIAVVNNHGARTPEACQG